MLLDGYAERLDALAVRVTTTVDSTVSCAAVARLDRDSCSAPGRVIQTGGMYKHNHSYNQQAPCCCQEVNAECAECVDHKTPL